MGHIINPITFRLLKTKFSFFVWNNLSKINYKKFLFEDFDLEKIFIWFRSFFNWLSLNLLVLNFYFLKYYKFLQINIKFIKRFSFKSFKFFNFKKLKKKKNFFFVRSKYKNKIFKTFIFKLFFFNKLKFFQKMFLFENFKKRKFYLFKKKLIKKTFKFFNFFKKKKKKKKKQIRRIYYFFKITNILFSFLKLRGFKKYNFKKKFNLYFLNFLNFFLFKKFKKHLGLFKRRLKFKAKVRFFKLIFFFRKNFLLTLLNNIFFNKNIILNFLRQKEFFVSADYLSFFIKMRIFQKYRVSHIINLLFKNLRRKKNIIGVELGFFGRYQKKLRNKKVWLLKGMVSPSNINSPLSYKSFFVLLRFGICGIKIYSLLKVFKNEIF